MHSLTEAQVEYLKVLHGHEIEKNADDRICPTDLYDLFFKSEIGIEFDDVYADLKSDYCHGCEWEKFEKTFGKKCDVVKLKRFIDEVHFSTIPIGSLVLINLIDK